MEWGRSSVPAKRGCLLHCRTGRGAARLAGFGCCGPWLPRCCHSRFRGNDDPVPSRSVPSDVFPSDPPMTDPRLDDLRRNIPGLRLETDPAELEHYGRDRTRRWPPAPRAIGLPADVEPVPAIVRWRGENRSEARRVGEGGVSKCTTRWSPEPQKKKRQ